MINGGMKIQLVNDEGTMSTQGLVQLMKLKILRALV
jgi:hypothetical protein